LDQDSKVIDSPKSVWHLERPYTFPSRSVLLISRSWHNIHRPTAIIIMVLFSEKSHYDLANRYTLEERKFFTSAEMEAFTEP